jgi:hypothetical protein
VISVGTVLSFFATDFFGDVRFEVPPLFSAEDGDSVTTQNDNIVIPKRRLPGFLQCLETTARIVALNTSRPSPSQSLLISINDNLSV